MANGDVYQKLGGVWTVVGNIAGPTGQPGSTGPAGSGGSPSTTDFRLTLASGNPVYTPFAATPSATNTTTMVCTFAAVHGWVTGTILTPLTTVGGLTAGTRYWINALSTTTVAFYTTAANAFADTSRVTLSANVTSQLKPSGLNGKTLFFSPYTGNSIGLFVGGAWAQLTSAEVSLGLGTLVSGSNYDVFVYSNSGVLTLELSVAWTGDNTRSDAIAQQDGVWVKSADHSRRLIGTIRMDSTTTTIDDAGGIVTQVGGKRFLCNLRNEVDFHARVFDSTSSWNYASNVWRQANGVAGNKCEMVTCLPKLGRALLIATIDGSSAQFSNVALGVNSITVPEKFVIFSSTNAGVSSNCGATVEAAIMVPAGYNSFNWLEMANSGTGNFTGGQLGAQSGVSCIFNL